MLKKIPVGLESFEKIRRDDFYYVDKTGLIKELFENWGEVNLFTRPRRFGKSLNMSMLQSFFETGCDKGLFAGRAFLRRAVTRACLRVLRSRRRQSSAKSTWENFRWCRLA